MGHVTATVVIPALNELMKRVEELERAAAKEEKSEEPKATGRGRRKGSNAQSA